MLAIVASLLVASAPAQAPIEAISVDEVERLLGRPGVTLVDVNVPEVWEDHHLPGAVHLEGEDLAPLLPRDRDATVVFYCYDRLCSASEEAAWEAVRLGYRRVRLMRDGIRGWLAAGKPVASE